jgi:hypothetical protein
MAGYNKTRYIDYKLLLKLVVIIARNQFSRKLIQILTSTKRDLE